jgi:hypothetical protein
VSDIAVVVPVLNRPQRAEPFMASLRETTDRATVYAVVNEADNLTWATWLQAKANVRLTRLTTFAEKVNYAYNLTDEAWVFLVGDDVVFHPGWADEAIRVSEETGAQVVGVNDLANPRTQQGTHAPHLLISRQYIAEQGASWDGPGVVCHEGYRHMFVDDEIVTVAKQRGTFAVAKDAVVEHLHPAVGKAEVDSTYRLGWSFADLDKSRFAERMREFQL